MSYSPKRFAASFASFVLVVFLIALVLSSQVSMAILPAVGIGGVFLQADVFEGEDADVYPEYGQLTSEYPERVTDTARCQQRPMLALRLSNANLQGYKIFKDIKLPYFENQWMSIVINQSDGSITTPLNEGELTAFVTQLQADELKVRNVRISEGESNDIWGPQSGEFLLEADPGNPGNVPASTPDLKATNAKLWLHSLVGDQINFNSPTGITLDVRYNTTTGLQSRYDSQGILNDVDEQRENYFDCLPAQPAQRGSLLSTDFESGVPTGWTTSNLAVTSATSNSGSDSVQMNGDGSVLQTPSLNLQNEVQRSVNYWIRAGDDSFSEDPDQGEFLIVEFRSERGAWNEVDTYEGVGPPFDDIGGTVYEGGFTLPDGAYHSNFSLRFRTQGGSTTQDNWHIDDVEIG